jgi:hypothetical protein
MLPVVVFFVFPATFDETIDILIGIITANAPIMEMPKSLTDR